MIKVEFQKKYEQAPTKIFATTKDTLKTSLLTKNDLLFINNALKNNDFKAKDGKIVSIFNGKEQILIVGIKEKSTSLSFEKIGGKLSPYLTKDEAIYFAEGQSSLCAVEESTSVAKGLLLGSYKFDKYITKKEKTELKKITFVLENANKAKTVFKNYLPVIESVYMARDLSSEPANQLTPFLFAEKIKTLKSTGLEIDILSQKELKTKKFGMLLSVAQGSQNEPKVAILKWIGNPKKKTFDLGLVGKGVTFDSGGISLKPGAGMGDMKQDMTGAGVVVSSMRSFALRKVKSNIIGIVGLVENMPSGTASRPGDIVTSLSGQTVEILNTDAEGRLVLGDCLWYIQSEYKVSKIIDLATLTGAVMATLGEEYAGLFSNDDSLAQNISEAGQNVLEEVWRLPINKAYDKMIKSDIADMKNIGGRLAGGSTAACFLQRFIKKGTSWAHLDIAGVDKFETARPTTPKGATGWGVRLLNELVK